MTSMLYAESVITRDKIRSNRPTVLLIVGSVPFWPLLAFFRERLYSLNTERAYAQAIGKLIEWIAVHAHEFVEIEKRHLIFTSFTHDLLFGTYSDDETDRNNLNWIAKSQQNLERLAGCVMTFSDWLTIRYGANFINPITNNASYADQIIFWHHWHHKKNGSLLKHLKSNELASNTSKTSRQFKLPNFRNKHLEQVKAFPIEYIEELLEKGFINPKHSNDNRYWLKNNVRDILITFLCLFGGCRPSEPMHLWVDDVMPDPDNPEVALVHIYEPHEGIVRYVDPMTGNSRKTNRADYLQRFCGGKKPLTMELGRRHSGWKGSLLTNSEKKAVRIYWINSEYGKLFLKYWYLYLDNVRPFVTNTPWAFLTKDSQPLGVDGYTDAFNTAIRRIGLQPSKAHGTSPHALRHRYGQWLNNLDINHKYGQVAMHHKNPLSQLVYRQPTIAEITESISEFNNQKKLEEK